MRLALLTNQIPPYRVATFAALRRKVDQLTVILSENRIAPGLENADIDIRVARSLRIPSVRRHDSGYFERYETHLPVGIVPALLRAAPHCVFAAELGMRTLGAVLYRLGSRTPVVVHADLSEHTERGRGSVRPALRRLLLTQIDGVMVNGRSGADYIRGLGFPGRAISMLPYATDVERFGTVQRLPGGGGELRLLYVGRLIELKGLEPWIGALARVLGQRPDRRVRLTLAGDGDRREAIEQLELPPNLRLRLLGQMTYAELPRVYADADVLVMPSLGDTWGLVVNEAMASGLPVVGSSQTQAVVELVRDGVEGWIFSAAEPASIDAAICRMLDTGSEKLAAMGADARRAALALSPDHVASALIAACRKARNAKVRGTAP
jgi:glycosyltransferase involved in cell wall biosynthesis